jgi:hypothetical protein
MTGITSCGGNFSFNVNTGMMMMMKRGERGYSAKEENSVVNKDLSEAFEMKSKKTTMFNNVNNCVSKGNVCDMSTVRMHSSVNAHSGKDKIKENDSNITYCVAFKWMCFPKGRKLQRMITKFERKLKTILSVENIVREIIRGKNNERMITLLESNNNNNGNIGSNVNNGNHVINNTNMRMLNINNNNNNKYLSYMYEPKCTIHSKQTLQSNNNNKLMLLNDEKSEGDSPTTQIKMRPVNLNVKFINKANFNVADAHVDDNNNNNNNNKSNAT